MQIPLECRSWRKRFSRERFSVEPRGYVDFHVQQMPTSLRSPNWQLSAVSLCVLPKTEANRGSRRTQPCRGTWNHVPAASFGHLEFSDFVEDFQSTFDAVRLKWTARRGVSIWRCFASYFIASWIIHAMWRSRCVVLFISWCAWIPGKSCSGKSPSRRQIWGGVPNLNGSKTCDTPTVTCCLTLSQIPNPKKLKCTDSFSQEVEEPPRLLNSHKQILWF